MSMGQQKRDRQPAMARRLIDLEAHEAVFTWMLQCLADAGLVNGKTVGVGVTVQVGVAPVQISASQTIQASAVSGAEFTQRSAFSDGRLLAAVARNETATIPRISGRAPAITAPPEAFGRRRAVRPRTVPAAPTRQSVRPWAPRGSRSGSGTLDEPTSPAADTRLLRKP